MAKALLIDPSLYDLNAPPIGDIEEIRKYNRQRFEMEQLTAIAYVDSEKHLCVGYKDTTENEFWVRGHMPGFPLMPGVIMCEAVGQMASYYAKKYFKIKGTLGFAGLDDVKFRGMVRPGDRLVIQSKFLHSKMKMISAEFICLVNTTVVCQGVVKGFVLDVEDPVE